MDQHEKWKNPKFVWGEWGAPRLIFKMRIVKKLGRVRFKGFNVRL
jgi:hypothetical protein